MAFNNSRTNSGSSLSLLALCLAAAILIALSVHVTAEAPPSDTHPVLAAFRDVIDRYESYDHFLATATKDDWEIYEAYIEYAESRLPLLRDRAAPIGEGVDGHAMHDAHPATSGLSQQEGHFTRSSVPTFTRTYTEADYEYTAADSTAIANATASVDLDGNMNLAGAWAGTWDFDWAWAVAQNGVVFAYSGQTEDINHTLAVTQPNQYAAWQWVDSQNRTIYQACYEYELSRPDDYASIAGNTHYGPDAGTACIDVYGTQVDLEVHRAPDGQVSESSITLLSVTVDPDDTTPIPASITIGGYYGVLLRAWYWGEAYFDLHLSVCELSGPPCWHYRIADHFLISGGQFGELHFDTFDDATVEFDLVPGTFYVATLRAEVGTSQIQFWFEYTVAESGDVRRGYYSSWDFIELAVYDD